MYAKNISRWNLKNKNSVEVDQNPGNVKKRDRNRLTDKNSIIYFPPIISAFAG